MKTQKQYFITKRFFTDCKGKHIFQFWIYCLVNGSYKAQHGTNIQAKKEATSFLKELFKINP